MKTPPGIISTDVINKIPLLEEFCTTKQKQILQQNSKHHFFKKDEAIFFDFQPAHFVYLIEKGKVKLWKDGIHSNNPIISISKEGGIIGFRGAIQNSNYVLCATALEDSLLHFIPSSVFIQLLQENHQLHLKILWTYIIQLNETERRLRNMAEMNVREKTADCLLMMINEFGLEKNNSTLNIKISRKDLASIAGISVDRLVKQLSEFEEEKLITASGQNINLLNLEKLQHVVAPFIAINS